MVRAADTPARRALASGAQSQLAEIETNIDLAAYQPAAVRPRASWLAARRYSVDEIGALGGPLLVSANNDTSRSAQITERLEVLAARFAVPATQAPHVAWRSASGVEYIAAIRYNRHGSAEAGRRTNLKAGRDGRVCAGLR